mmetsp:Transcript_22071/g.31648  ORF Transcript_22071/g.31648 Transcript_22071/m.31648 type:complete len:197 (+) Transcript_22071:578-1168(+)
MEVTMQIYLSWSLGWVPVHHSEASQQDGHRRNCSWQDRQQDLDGCIQKKLPEYYILLDNQANLPVFYNEKLLTRTWRVKTTMRINSDGRISETNWKGWFPGYAEVWLHRDGIANILPFCEVKKMFRVTYASDNNDTFTVHKQNGSQRKFVTGNIGLYYWDAKAAYKEHVKEKGHAVLKVNPTVLRLNIDKGLVQCK